MTTNRVGEGVVLKGRLTLERVTFYVSAKTLEGALACAANWDFDGCGALPASSDPECRAIHKTS